eukprot:570295-Rhodomonas_salina.1
MGGEREVERREVVREEGGREGEEETRGRGGRAREREWWEETEEGRRVRAAVEEMRMTEKGVEGLLSEVEEAVEGGFVFLAGSTLPILLLYRCFLVPISLLLASYALSGNCCSYSVAMRCPVLLLLCSETLSGNDEGCPAMRPRGNAYVMSGERLRSVTEYLNASASMLTLWECCSRVSIPVLSLTCVHAVHRMRSQASISAISLRACYVISGTDMAFGAICLRACYAMPGTELAWSGREGERKAGAGDKETEEDGDRGGG